MTGTNKPWEIAQLEDGHVVIREYVQRESLAISNTQAIRLDDVAEPVRSDINAMIATKIARDDGMIFFTDEEWDRLKGKI